MSTYAPARPTKFCPTCGTSIDAMAVVCPRCGVMQPAVAGASQSEKRILPAFLLCFFLGVFGAHRFYVGKIGTGILQLLTLGGLGIWALIDLIFIIVGNFTDGDGEKITEWT
ncbi:MAG TPA: TM2 domain-containing protein [Gemmatimonadaceae bacterium]|nr:TM2 domain-containing protein [Gemmatimonadaceae bacterium]